MTIEEAKAICKKLTDLNIAIWTTSNRITRDMLRTSFKNEAKRITDAGFRIKKWRDHGTPMYGIRINRHVEDLQIETTAPDGSTYQRDCTTRCISFCTGVDYETIRAEQFKHAHDSGKTWMTWRHTAAWEKCLLSRGFTRLNLDKRHVSRSTFLKMAKSLPVHDGKIATVSSGHVAAIDMVSRKVLDTWNSTGGRILYIYVPSKTRDLFYSWLKKAGCCM